MSAHTFSSSVPLDMKETIGSVFVMYSVLDEEQGRTLTNFEVERMKYRRQVRSLVWAVQTGMTRGVGDSKIFVFV